MTHSHGATTSTRSVPKCLATSIFFAISLGFFLSFFFSSLNLTFSLYLTTVTLSGQGAPNPKLPDWRPSSTMPVALSFINVEGPPHRLLVGNQAFPPWLPGENFTLLLTCSTVCTPSPLLIFLNFFLCLHPATTPTLLHLPSSTFHLIDLPLAKSHSVSLAQHCGDFCHQTSGIPRNSTVFTHFTSIILGKIFDFYHLHVHDISLTCSS